MVLQGRPPSLQTKFSDLLCCSSVAFLQTVFSFFLSLGHLFRIELRTSPSLWWNLSSEENRNGECEGSWTMASPARHEQGIACTYIFLHVYDREPLVTSYAEAAAFHLQFQSMLICNCLAFNHLSPPCGTGFSFFDLEFPSSPFKISEAAVTMSWCSFNLVVKLGIKAALSCKKITALQVIKTKQNKNNQEVVSLHEVFVLSPLAIDQLILVGVWSMQGWQNICVSLLLPETARSGAPGIHVRQNPLDPILWYSLRLFWIELQRSTPLVCNKPSKISPELSPVKSVRHCHWIPMRWSGPQLII